ncbi:MAG: M1 family peptidase [Sphingobacteriaceae bacterium]|nr:MAG: M1 family peptidase [Sphingobacteriaceae bacterium]
MKKYWICIIMLLYILPVAAQVSSSAIDVQGYKFNLVLTDADNSIKGKATISVFLLQNTETVQFDLVKKGGTGTGMTVSSVTENGKLLRFEHEGEILKIYTPVKAKSTHSYTVNYSGVPADGLIISTNKFGDRTFFGDNWLKRAHHWLPCVDDVADKATVNFTVTAPKHYTVVSNGLKQKETIAGKMKTTYWSETVPIPTKIMVIGVAKFAVDNQGKVGGIPVYSYVFPQDKAAGFKSYRNAADILPFFIEKIGPYAYKKLANVQSKTIFNGMENASVIFYSQKSVTDADVEELIAHEIGHQWFGDAVTEKGPHDVWLSEGFASYLAHYYHEHKYGRDSLSRRMLSDKKNVLAFEKTRLTPVVDTTPVTDYMDLLNDNSYEKGSWVLHMLRHKLGDTTFWQGIKTYYAQYKNTNANTQDFIAVMEKTSGQNLQQFFKQWLYTAGHPVLKIAFDTSTEKGKIVVRIEQQQDFLYDIPLDYVVNGQPYTVNIKDKITTFKIQLPINEIGFDPDVNSLAEIIMDNPEYRIKE